eukprot:TRINITY_DN28757_c0_g1_i1.p1 TRINITY_DN28757_c0_g1~~TRINITY_DN28757_c0_g1_i1.p1  ORF type:complete len:486 (+),score=138.59 TRINITY_DN28757_c0_g1_i1:97-1458(+)
MELSALTPRPNFHPPMMPPPQPGSLTARGVRDHTPRRLKHRHNGEPTWLGFGGPLGAGGAGREGERERFCEKQAEAAQRAIDRAISGRVAAAWVATQRQVPAWSPRRVQRLWHGGKLQARAMGLSVKPEPTTMSPFGTMLPSGCYEVSSHAAHSKAALVMPRVKLPCAPAPAPPPAAAAAAPPAAAAAPADEVTPGAPAAEGPQRPPARYRRRKASGRDGATARRRLVRAAGIALRTGDDPERAAVRFKRPAPRPDPEAKRVPLPLNRRKVNEACAAAVQAHHPLHCMLPVDWVTSAKAASAAVEANADPPPERHCSRPPPEPATRPGGIAQIVFPEQRVPEMWPEQRAAAAERMAAEAGLVPAPPARRVRTAQPRPRPAAATLLQPELPPPGQGRRANSARQRLDKLKAQRSLQRYVAAVPPTLTGACVRSMALAQYAPDAESLAAASHCSD